MKPLAVIAHYNKDLGWTNELSKIGFDRLVYTKSINFSQHVDCPVLTLPNVGREAHTYAHHIVENFDTTPDDQITVFLQDDAPRHCQDLIPLLSALNTTQFAGTKDFMPISVIQQPFKLSDALPPVARKMTSFPYSGEKTEPSIWIKDYLEPIFNGETLDYEKEYAFPVGAHFAVRQSAIKRAGIDIFKRIIKYTEHAQHPVEAVVMERLWPLIFLRAID